MSEFFEGIAKVQQDASGIHSSAEKVKNACTCCGKRILPLSPVMVEKIYGKAGDSKGLSKMCPQCRRKLLWKDWALSHG